MPRIYRLILFWLNVIYCGVFIGLATKNISYLFFTYFLFGSVFWLLTLVKEEKENDKNSSS